MLDGRSQAHFWKGWSILSLGALCIASLLIGSSSLVSAAGNGGASNAGGGVNASGGASTPAAPGAPVSTGGSNAATPGSSSGAVSGPTNSSVLLRMGQRSIFILVFAPDPLTTNFVSYETSLNLSHFLASAEEAGNGVAPVKWILPEPGWSLQDFSTQCENDPNETAGAFVIYDIENDNGSFNFAVATNTYDHLYGKALYVGCQAFSPPFLSEHVGITTYTQQESYTGVPPTPVTPSSTSCPAATPCSPSPVTYKPASTKATQYTYPSPKPPKSTSPGNGKDSGYKSQVVRSTSSTGQSTTSVTTTYPSPSPKDDSGTTSHMPQKLQKTITETANNPSQYQATQTTNVIPTMTVQWASVEELDSGHFAANQFGIPFISVAALGTYLASRTYQQTTYQTTTAPSIPGQSTNNGSVAVSVQRQGNNSALPYGLGYLGASLSNLGTLTFGGTNQSRVLKSAAASLASALRRQLDHDCVDGTTWVGDRRMIKRHESVKRKQDAPQICAVFTTDL